MMWWIIGGLLGIALAAVLHVPWWVFLLLVPLVVIFNAIDAAGRTH